MELTDRKRIKVCGMRDKENIAQLSTLPIDYIGFIFYEKSARYAGNQIDPSILKIIPSYIQKVGVFVNMPVNEVIETAKKNQIEFLQLHGEESPEYCNDLLDRGYSIIKAFKADKDELQKKINEYRFACNYYLFDTPTKKYGGSGQKFNWDILQSLKIYLPFFLSGGISPEDAEILKKFNLLGFHAIDINSRFETSPGIKNIEEVKKFIKEFQQQ